MDQGERRRAESSRANKTRRSWSEKEEEVLLRCLKEIVAEGWKSDNGFRAGYLNRLESMMVKAFPGTDMKAVPHINSKVHVWKKDYSSLISMMAKSGIGFMHDTNMIEATDDAWESYKKVDSNARLMRYKTWPMFKDWIEVFGKDRATGEGAEDMTEAADDVGDENSMNNKEKTINEDARQNDEAEHEGDNVSVFINSVSQSERSTSGKKRKFPDESQGVLEVLSKFLANSESRLNDIASSLVVDKEAKAARQQLFNALQGIAGLTTGEKMKAADMMLQHTERMDFFQSLPAEARADYVFYLLTSTI